MKTKTHAKFLVRLSVNWRKALDIVASRRGDRIGKKLCAGDIVRNALAHDTEFQSALRRVKKGEQ